MKITLCHSLNFVEKAREIKKELIGRGYEVFTTPYIDKTLEEIEKIRSDKKNYLNNLKTFFIKEHFDKISKSDAILVVNLDKKGIKNYIGGNTFAEIMVAFYLNKKIFLLNPIPTDEKLSYIRDEIEAIKPIIINENLDLING
jgi:diphthamide synthase subunit DPH2